MHTVVLVLLALFTAGCRTQGNDYLPFVMLNTTDGVETQQLGRFDDGVSPAIFITGGAPFGNSIQTIAYVATNGIISFAEPFYFHAPSAFPGLTTEVSDAYLVAPYWSDVDIRMEGDILYEIHTADDNPRSDMLLAQVSEFVYNQTGEDFSGTWMLVAQWDGVHPWPAGADDVDYYQYLYYYFFGQTYTDLEDENTYQGIVITNGTSTYAVFVYQCGFMEWSRGGVTIGYNAAGDYFENHPLTGSAEAHTIACANSPAEWNNVIYKLSVEHIVTPPPPPTIEPPQNAYLPFLERTGINSQTLTGCDDCSAFINLTANTRFPMSYYLHDSIWVTSNGIISIGRNFTLATPALFPTEIADSYYAFLVAPYWADADLRSEGEVYWEIHTIGTAVSEDLLDRVNGFIADEYGDTQFTGNWMLVANWSGVRPFPQNDPEEIAQDPHLQLANTFQAILITNSTKSYAVFTYNCDLMRWSGDAAIGFNAAAELFENHPLSGLTSSNAIACVHTTEGSDLNNVIYDLVPDGLLADATTPQPRQSVGTCADAGYTSCCTDGLCLGGEPGDCYCDEFCYSLGDCCHDIDDICGSDEPIGNGTYLAVANFVFVNRVNLDGTGFQTLVTDTTMSATAFDFHYNLGKMFWSDTAGNTIQQANLDGTERVILLNDSVNVPEGLAVDWIANNLYWTDALYARIEVMSLDTTARKELLRTGPNTTPRGIVVDPNMRLMYWTDWGSDAKIERASMDGTSRTVLHTEDLVWPNGLTLDYPEQRLYWADAFLDKIEYSNADGTGRQVLETSADGLVHPFDLTIAETLLVWTEWSVDSIFAAHKLHGGNFTTIYSGLFLNPDGIEAITPDRQPNIMGTNPCEGSGCSHLCLLSSTATAGYACACPDNAVLGDNGRDCNFTAVTPTSAPQPGSCTVAGYSECCTGGFCAGSPPNCFCDLFCPLRGDCCFDISVTCPEVTPSPPPITIEGYLPFVMLNTTDGVETQQLGRFDDGVSPAIFITGGAPFGNSIQTIAYVATNGIISFAEPFYFHVPSAFPGLTTEVSDAYLVAPYWSDVDIRMEGDILYEIHTADDNPRSDMLLAQVSEFVYNQTGEDFSGTWMLVAQWDGVHPWPAGADDVDYYQYVYYYFFGLTYTDLEDENTYQGIVITNGITTYAVFVYQCGFMEWSRGGVTIGYNAAGYFENHPLTGSAEAHTIACANSPAEWNNVIYKLSVDHIITQPPPPTIEPAQNAYLSFLERTGINSQTLTGCDDCSAFVNLTANTRFPMSYYLHDSIWVTSNGIISIGRNFTLAAPALFPTEIADSYYAFLVAPYWADADLRSEGEVYWEIHTTGTAVSEDLLDRVNGFIADEYGDTQFTGNWMLVANWSGVRPFPQNDPEEIAQDPHLQLANTFQAILITNSTKSYAVFTYHCDLMEWSGDAAIGFNAAAELFENHPLSGLTSSNAIGCVHTTEGSDLNNVIYDLVPDGLLADATTPQPLQSVGACADAGYTSCCTDGLCLGGEPGDCYCDEFCYSLGDCCHDIDDICGSDEPIGNGTYLAFANFVFVNRVNLDGTGFQTLVTDTTMSATAFDFHYNLGKMFWSDTAGNTIQQANLDGTERVILLNDSVDVPEGLAVDWIANNIYWTDALYARIEVMSLDTTARKELLRTGPNTTPRGIVVDPNMRLMYWTDWGFDAKIERASMDGTSRTVLHTEDLVWPNGLALDYPEQRLYWADAFLDKIEYSNADGTGRQVLETSADGLVHPFDLTIAETLLVWTEWSVDSIFAAHKLHGGNFTTIYSGLFLNPDGIEAITPDRQPNILGTNPCEGSGCSHLCLLSSTATAGYACACPDNAVLGDNGRDCNFTAVTPTSAPLPGSCTVAGYSECCTGGFCAGSPPNCFCDNFCPLRGDCCFDISVTCPEVTPSPPPITIEGYLPFVMLNTTDGVETQQLGRFDDGVSPAIFITGGAPFGNSIQTIAYVATNGIISFAEPFYFHVPSAFPGLTTEVSDAYLVAPYWSDVDIRMEGDILYEIHTADDNPRSDMLLAQVSEFVYNQTGEDFSGTWMLVAQWDGVHPWPAGADDVDYYQYLYYYFFGLTYTDLEDENTYQGIVITNGITTYAVFVYQCGFIEWSRGGVTIGYNAAGYFENHPLTGSAEAHTIACANSPAEWNNVIYKLSVDHIITQPPPPTIEPAQNAYLSFLERTGINSQTLTGCDDCSAFINLTANTRFPMSYYLHDSIWVTSNGIISIGRNFTLAAPALFPTEIADSYYAFLVAPYWADADLRSEGEVYWEIHTTGTAVSEDLLDRVNGFIADEYGDTQFTGNWMLVANWSGVRPFPQNDPEEIAQDPHLQLANTFQAILITNSTKSYAVFTYNCDLMRWSGDAAIGFNAAAELFENHPLSGLTSSNAIGCVHTTEGSDLNNVIYDLVPDGLLADATTPQPLQSVGTCADAGYTSCCTDGLCLGGEPGDCYCDEFCYSLGDCCHDIDDICGSDEPIGNGTYLAFANFVFVNRVNLDGTGFQTLVTDTTMSATAFDFHYNLGKMFWSDTAGNTIQQANLDGTERVILLNDSVDVPEGLAVDWIANNLYWTDALYARIEVMSLDTTARKELLRTGPNTTPRGIVVDPNMRLMYWTDWGSDAKIERASMDGTSRTVLHTEDLVWPNGLALDYPEQRLYWADAFLDKIEYSNADGTGRQVLETSADGLVHPFDLTIAETLLVWTEWSVDSIFAAHKLHGGNFTTIYSGLFLNPDGIEAITPDRQPNVLGTNPCEGSGCSHLCLLSSTATAGYVCACPDDAVLGDNGRDCNFTGVTPTPTPPPGSCTVAGYSECCTGGFCAGSPPNCFCDLFCTIRGDCCFDIGVTCPEVTPSPTPEPSLSYLPYVTLNSTEGVETRCVGHVVDGVSSAIHIPVGFPFGNVEHTIAYVGTNGIISFGEPFYSFSTTAFPGFSADVANAYVVAPFWEDIDIRMDGDICYEVHTANDNPRSDMLLAQVSEFVYNQTGEDFSGTWMLVAQWDGVHPWPAGSDFVDYYQYYYYYFYGQFYTDLEDENTFQAIVITNGNSSYAVFVYQCDFMQWSRDTTIGYNGAGDYFENHPLTGTSGADVIDCVNSDTTPWSNLVYKLSVEDIVPPQPPPTVEPPQDNYLGFLESININRGTLSRCNDCSALLDLSANPFPMGSYYHTSIYVTSNGILSVGKNFTQSAHFPFPTSTLDIYYGYLIAPFWSNVDTRLDGQVYWEYYVLGNNPDADGLINRVSEFLRNEQQISFNGASMVVVTWENVHPWPHGESEEQDRVDPYLQEANTYQAIVITDFTKTYAVFTYNCDQMQWSDEAVIGFNAAGDFFTNHPLSGLLEANAIACVHTGGSSPSPWNNVIYDIVPGQLFNMSTPPTPTSIGTCAAASYTECCEDGLCAGDPEDCYCDEFCRQLGDCCHDIDVTCPIPVPVDNTTYLIFANHFSINRVNVDGSGSQILISGLSGGAIGIDFHYSRGHLYWSDYFDNEIWQANLDGTAVVLLLNDSVEIIDDIAVDWINDKLYWTDSVYARIEVMDIDKPFRKELLRTGPNTNPRAIAVDPRSRLIYWTDWGTVGKIEKASMDGQGREVIIDAGLVWPSGLTLDYVEDRMYWTDAFLSRIEYSNFDGTGRTVVETPSNGVISPFGITIDAEFVFWTEWNNNSIFAAHKIDLGSEANGFTTIYTNPFFNPNGIEGVSVDQQPDADNPCDGNQCSHLCLLSAVADEMYTCACPDGGVLEANRRDCDVSGVTPTPPVPEGGSCGAAGYSECCTGGYCAGDIPNCFCNEICHAFGDCCDDIEAICPEPQGSCRDAGFTTCCTGIFCAGQPFTGCYCDVTCIDFGDCCDDFYEICPVVTTSIPVLPSSTEPTQTSTQPTQTSTQPTPTQTPPPLVPPGQVVDINLQPLSVMELVISWSAPPMTENQDLMYTVTVNNSTEQVFQDVTAELTVTVSGLDRWIPYYISIIATNDAGDGETAQTTGFTEEGTPSVSPSDVGVDRTNGTHMTVSWTPLTLEEARGFVSGYTITYGASSRKRQADPITFPGDSSSGVIGGLTPGVSYSVAVAASTSAGTGVESEPVAVPTEKTPEVAEASKGGLGGGAVAGIVIVIIFVVVVVLVVAVAAIYLIQKRRKARYYEFENETSSINRGDEGAEVALEEYQPGGKKEVISFEKAASSGNVTGVRYTSNPTDGIDNPVYETNVDIGTGIPVSVATEKPTPPIGDEYTPMGPVMKVDTTAALKPKEGTYETIKDVTPKAENPYVDDPTEKSAGDNDTAQN